MRPFPLLITLALLIGLLVACAPTQSPEQSVPHQPAPSAPIVAKPAAPAPLMTFRVTNGPTGITPSGLRKDKGVRLLVTSVTPMHVQQPALNISVDIPANVTTPVDIRAPPGTYVLKCTQGCVNKTTFALYLS